MLKKFKLLTIDSDPESFKAVTDIVIHHPEYHVTHLDSTNPIYEIIHYQSFELAICEFEMASKDDFNLVRTLKKTYPDMGILLLVNTSDDRFSVEALEAGADGFFNKAFTYEKFALIHEAGYWNALDRADWWTANEVRLLAHEEVSV